MVARGPYLYGGGWGAGGHDGDRKQRRRSLPQCAPDRGGGHAAARRRFAGDRRDRPRIRRGASGAVTPRRERNGRTRLHREAGMPKRFEDLMEESLSDRLPIDVLPMSNEEF